MVDDAHLLRSVKGDTLDRYLHAGWYRGGNYVFTTHFVAFTGEKYYRVFWLRYNVQQVQLSSTNRKLLRQNSQFTAVIKRFSFTEELAELHARYVARLPFRTSQSLPELLVDLENKIFRSYLVEIRDRGKLIAAAIFDRGKETIAGIVNIYDHDYKKYSPGKFMMLLKYHYCLKHNIPWYYPGYYSPEYPVFDYKLFLDKNATEVMVPGINLWIPYHQFTTLLAPAKE